MRDASFKLTVRGITLVVILIVLWALGFLRAGPNVVH